MQDKITATCFGGHMDVKGKNKAMVWCYAPKQVYTN